MAIIENGYRTVAYVCLQSKQDLGNWIEKRFSNNPHTRKVAIISTVACVAFLVAAATVPTSGVALGMLGLALLSGIALIQAESISEMLIIFESVDWHERYYRARNAYLD